jgi:hypothetical protein
MDRRLELHDILNSVPGIKKAYFQPPETQKLEYPCIIYQLQAIYMQSADDYPYKNRNAYSVTIIDRNPDSAIHKELEKMQLCRFERFYVGSSLNHWVYQIYY